MTCMRCGKRQRGKAHPTGLCVDCREAARAAQTVRPGAWWRRLVAWLRVQP